MSKKFSKYKPILVTITFFVLVSSIATFIFFKEQLMPSIKKPTTPELLISDGCTRTSRLENAPQYDRALSLIHQRITENHEQWPEEGKYSDARFTHFPPNLVNCIKIVEEDLGRDEEGYFIFHSEEIQPNYFPIAINSNYKFSDDVLTALLITHEMTHVQQFIESLNNNDNQSCREKEVSAFISQLDFYVQLNNEENYAFYLRMNDERDNQHSQVEMIKAMTTINRESNCNIVDFECKDKNLRNKLFELVTSNPHYREQCGVI